MRRRRTRPTWQLVLVLAGGLVYGLLHWFDGGAGSLRPSDSQVGGPTAGAVREAEIAVSPRLLEAIERRQSEVWVETAATVRRILRDDTRGSQHQRFLVDVAGNSVLVAHNIDLAPRVPLREGQVIALRGRFEWNDKGGVLHWTHHDPDGRLVGGWIRADGESYQ